MTEQYNEYRGAERGELTDQEAILARIA